MNAMVPARGVQRGNRLAAQWIPGAPEPVPYDHNEAVRAATRGEEPMLGSASDFVFESRERGVGLKSAVLEYAALDRGLQAERFDNFLVVVNTPKSGPLAFRNMNGPLSSIAGRTLCDRKQYARRLLGDEGISVVPSRLFPRGERRAAWRYAQSIGLPAVLKPPGMSRSRGITVGIGTWEEFAEGWRRVMREYRRPDNAEFLVEKHIYGEDYRIFVVGGKVFSATHRKRASVVGDGSSTVQQLIDNKNAVRAAHPSLLDYLIPVDPAALDALEASGRAIEDVPGEGEEVVLRSISNLAAGGDSIDVTDHLHPTLGQVAQNAVAAIPGVEYAGVDIIASSIEDPASAGSHVVSEVEFSPAPITNFPVEGTPRDMGGALVDYYLQRYRISRWPSLRGRARPTR